jgi:hypothetical protein
MEASSVYKKEWIRVNNGRKGRAVASFPFSCPYPSIGMSSAYYRAMLSYTYAHYRDNAVILDSNAVGKNRMVYAVQLVIFNHTAQAMADT